MKKPMELVASDQKDRHARHGSRHGSRTPRARVREAAVSPECGRHAPAKYTPNGTRVPDGPPPIECEQPMPPVPPIPGLHEALKSGEGHQSSFVSEIHGLDIYDTCESKPKMKSGNTAWKPFDEREGVLTASEAKQFWMEKENHSLKLALDRVSVPQVFQQSDYWNGNFQPGFPTVGRVPPAVAACIAHGREGGNLRGGSGDHGLQARACAVPSERRDGVRASQLQAFGEPAASSERFDGVRASHVQVLGEHPDQARAQRLHDLGETREQARAPNLHGDLYGPVRASNLHGDLRGQARAQQVLGELCGRDRASSEHGGLHGRGRASMDGAEMGLHHNGPQESCHLPGHGAGGGGFGDGRQGRPFTPWPENMGTTMNTKGELPDLPADSSPLQFGDWLHLIAPIMKDISGAAGWWWETAMREARGFYEEWKVSTPLQRIQIAPRLPEELKEHQFQRTEQRGIQMLLKAIPEAEQQSLVTDRALSSTAILYKLLIRFQPGGAGEKQILLQQLTSIPKTPNVKELATALRNWRRHFGRAQEVNATLPDGVLLLKALDGPIQQLGALDPQAAFRLAQSRMQLGLDEMPTQQALWSYSQCLLAEAETLVLLQTNSLTLSAPQTPSKLKQMQGDPKTPTTATPTDGKPKGNSIEKPCKYFLSDAGCRAGKACRWLHSWEGITDKASRCFICGSKEHRKIDCKLRSGKAKGEPTGSGGGYGHGRGHDGSTSSTPSTGTVGGKAGAAAVKVAKSSGGDETSSTATVEGGGSGVQPPEVTSSATNGDKDGGRGGGQESGPKADKTAELLHEATQLLKTLRGPMNPKLKVMQLSNVETVDEEYILLDSGATHALRPARDEGEWMAAERTSVQLADGTTEMFRLKKNTKILLAAPTTQISWIIPMGGLSDLDFSLEWRDGLCKLKDDEGREVRVELRNGCPMISRQEGEKIMEWLELFYVHQWRKLAVVKTMLADVGMVDLNMLTLETAMTVKMKKEFPGLPDHIMMKLIPYLEMVKAEDFGARLPWNRHKRRRLLKAKRIILHIFSGPDSSYWEKQCGSADTEVLCVDTEGSHPANLHDKNVYGFLVALCASGRVKAIIGGPPCRTVSALRYQDDEGPGVVRNDEHPYGLPDLPPKDAALVEGDTILMFRFLSLMTLCEDVRPADDEVPTAFLMEQPEDPAKYRDEADVQQHRYFSMFRTQEWQDFQTRYGLSQFSFDQCTMGYTKRKPTTIGTNLMELAQLDELRGQPEGEAQAAEQFRALPMEQRFKTTKSWAAWAPGLKAAIAAGLNRYLKGAGRGPDSVQHQASGSNEVPESDLSSVQPRALRTISQLALESWKAHFLNDHLPARRDCAHCVRAQARSRPHRRVTHPEAYTLSVDLSGKMTSGVDQEHQRARYLMVACYTFPVMADGRPMVDPPGASKDEQDQPLPSMDLHGGGGLSSSAGQPSPSMDLYGGETVATMLRFHMMEFLMMMMMMMR